MTRVLLVAAASLGTIPFLFAGGPAGQFTSVTSTQQMNFGPGGTIRLNNSYGDLYVEGWDRPQVEIAIIKSTHFSEPARKEETAQRLDSVQVAVDRKSDIELTISTTVPARKDWAPPLPGSTTNGVLVEYHVHVPRNTRLVIDHSSGSVLVGNVTAEIEASNHSGDIMLLLPEKGSYSIDARSKLGHIASDFAGDTKSRFLVGQSFIGPGTSPSSRRIYLRTGFGGITIVALPPEGEALSTGGGE